MTIDHHRGEFCWAHLGTPDVARAAEFYTALLGWEATFSEIDGAPEATFTADGRAVAGASTVPAGLASSWSIFLSTPGIEADLAACERAGATILQPATEVATTGKFAMLADPSGAVVGLWQAGPFAGFELFEEVGGPTWFELAARGIDEAERFYTDVFGWDLRPAPVEMRYDLAWLDGREVAGVMDGGFLPPQVPSAWSWYVGVEDCARAAARVVELGGAVLMEPDASPFGVLAWVADPSGAAFKLHQMT